MRQRDVEQLPHLVARFLQMMPETLLIQYSSEETYPYKKQVAVRVRPMSYQKGHIRVALKGPNSEDIAFFNISRREAEKAANGGVGEVFDLVQEGAGAGMDFIEGNHKLWDMLTGKQTQRG